MNATTIIAWLAQATVHDLERLAVTIEIERGRRRAVASHRGRAVRVGTEVACLDQRTFYTTPIAQDVKR